MGKSKKKEKINLNKKVNKELEYSIKEKKLLKSSKIFFKKIPLFLITFFSIFYFELFYKLSIFGFNNFINLGTLYLLIFILGLSGLITLFSTIFKSSKTNKITYLIIMSFLYLLFSVSLLFKKVFNTYFCFSLFSLADQALTFSGTAIIEILKNILYLLGLFIPILLIILLKKNIDFNKNNKIGAFLCFFLSIPLFKIVTYKDNFYTELISKTYNNALNIENFGITLASYLDIKELLFKYDKLSDNISSDNLINSEISEGSDNIDSNQETEYSYNNLDINFTNLISNENDETLLKMHNYFANDKGTLKNEYTGLFKDKNLIVIMAESLNTIGIKEDITPTLYKLAHTGFNFTNFYTPVNLSTIGGEFQNLTSLFANLNDLNKYFRKGTNYFPFGLGTVFKNAGYNVNAYHANDAYFQNRNTYLKNMGFTYFKAKNTGLEKLMDCNKWPASDDEMIQVTTDEWLDSSPFLTYYVSVSSHMPYNRSGNAIVSKNWHLVSNLNYSDEAKGYLASVIELDKAVARLIKSLEEKGKLDDTVIAIIPDHYPYSMNLDTINELSTYKRDETIEVNKSTLIIWNSKMESVTVPKVATQLDFLPTIYNLFALPFDSRLLMGKDILSTEPGLAYFQNKSWVSDYGTYYASSKKFVLKETKEVPEDYVSNINKIVANRINMSKLLIEKDYYRQVYNEE